MAKKIEVPTPTQEEIAARAHEIYVKSGQVEGRDVDNWLLAEAELTVEVAAAAASKKVGRRNAAKAP